MLSVESSVIVAVAVVLVLDIVLLLSVVSVEVGSADVLAVAAVVITVVVVRLLLKVSVAVLTLASLSGVGAKGFAVGSTARLSSVSVIEPTLAFSPLQALTNRVAITVIQALGSHAHLFCAGNAALRCC